jgi:hypothetical protein
MDPVKIAQNIVDVANSPHATFAASGIIWIEVKQARALAEAFLASQ